MPNLKFIPVVEDEAPRLIRAAQYLRMSTNLQRYSIENQEIVLTAYAEKNGMRITHTYADRGRSGLTVKGRPALQALLEDVRAGADFDVLLVYDVSRWGRFQDVDESAYHEYVCRRAGVPIIYCAELFGDDSNPMAAVLKSIKRVMAGEYSRELSVKVFVGQCRVVELGYRGGGPCGYGLRRLLVDRDGTPKAVLQAGERKSLTTDRIILVPGPPEEVAVVRQIFDDYVLGKMTKRAIARKLNDQGVKTDSGRPWERSLIMRILENEKYVGHNVFNRTTSKMQGSRRLNPPERWVRADNAFEPIVDAALFARARRRSRARSGEMSKAEMLETLKQLLAAKGRLSAAIIDADEATPSSSTYKKFFGSLTALYALIGYQPNYDLTNVLAFNARYHEARRKAKKAGQPYHARKGA